MRLKESANLASPATDWHDDQALRSRLTTSALLGVPVEPARSGLAQYLPLDVGWAASQ